MPEPRSVSAAPLIIACGTLLLFAAASAESEARLRLVANSEPALISYVDREQRYRFSNRTYDEWFGIAHERMQGRTVAEVFGEGGLRARAREFRARARRRAGRA